MTPIQWEKCRQADGSINLEVAATHTGCFFTEGAIEYLRMVEKLKSVTSRQIAALAIASALEISAREPHSHEGAK